MSNQTPAPTPARVEAVAKVLGTEATAEHLHISRNTLRKYRAQDASNPVEEGILALIELHIGAAEAAARTVIEAKQRELSETAAQLGMAGDAKAPSA